MKIKEWNRLFSQLGNERDEFIELIRDNEYFPEKVLGISSATQKQFLTTPRLISLLDLISPESPILLCLGQ